jgi:hypothetical protein
MFETLPASFAVSPHPEIKSIETIIVIINAKYNSFLFMCIPRDVQPLQNAPFHAITMILLLQAFYCPVFTAIVLSEQTGSYLWFFCEK